MTRISTEFYISCYVAIIFNDEPFLVKMLNVGFRSHLKRLVETLIDKESKPRAPDNFYDRSQYQI